MNILISINKGFIKYSKDMLFSLAYHNKDFLNVYLMYMDLEEREISDLKEYVQKSCHGMLIPCKFDSSNLQGMPTTNGKKAYFGLEAYSRLLCQFILPDEVEKILYLDVDMLINKDLSELYNLEFEGSYYIACSDIEANIDNSNKERLDLPMDYNYVNSGMLLINVKKLRKNHSAKYIYEFIRDVSNKLVYPDQDVLNLLYLKNIKVVSNRYNCVIKSLKCLKENISDIVIYHYAGQEKTWKIKGGRYNIKYLIPYYKCLYYQKRIMELVVIFVLHRIYHTYYIIWPNFKKVIKKIIRKN